jgi:putative FmdB family regulatory protein
MPIYEYKCLQCGQKFEVRRRITEEPLKVHADCGGEVEQLISAPALHFKGTGWYVTDYAKGGNSPAPAGPNGHADSKSESKGDGESKSESKAETKAESKSESKTESKSESKSEPSPATK